jgi:hypothetical protein
MRLAGGPAGILPVDLLEGFSVPAGFGDELTQASRSRQHDLGHSGAISAGVKLQIMI